MSIELELLDSETPTARTIRMVMEEAAARERELCAKIAERFSTEENDDAYIIARAIRSQTQ